MISPTQAYELFIEKYPDARGRTLVEWDDYYSCSGSLPGDFVDGEWKIDKKTGAVTHWDIAQYVEDAKTHKWIKQYWISLPTYMSAFIKALIKRCDSDTDIK